MRTDRSARSSTRGVSPSREEYWFDATPLAESRSGINPLIKLASVLPGRRLTGDQHEALYEFGKANGRGYVSCIENRERAVPLPSLVLDGTCEMIVLDGPRTPGVSDDGVPYLEIGNHGWRFWKAEDDGAPSRRGYIAIRHDLDLPHMYLASQGPAAATVLAASSTVANVAGFFDLDRTDPALTPVETFRQRATRLDLPSSLGFTVYVDANYSTTRSAQAELKAKFGRKAKAEGKLLAAREAELDAARAATAAALLDGPAAALLSELAASFDIEVEREWIYAYSSFGELSTLDPEIWAWAFGSASRLIDVLEAWGAKLPGARGRPWYTAERIERPKKVEGELRALMPKRGGKIKKVLFGGERD